MVSDNPRPGWRTLARQEALALLVLAAVPLILFFKVTIGGWTLIPVDNLMQYQPWASVADDYGLTHPEHPQNELVSDLVLQNIAWKRFINAAIEARQVPLWNPALFAGVPFLASGQHSALYPFSVLFYIFPPEHAYGWFLVLQYFLAGVFAYLLVRGLGVTWGGALVSGVVYEASLFMVVSAVFPMIVAGAVWLPLGLLAVELVVRQQPVLGRPASLPWLMLGAGAVGMQVLAGHPEVIYYSALIMGAYSAWRMLPWVWGWREHWRDLLRASVFLLVMMAVGLALGGIQLLPLLELVTQNFRSGSATLAEVRGWGFPARRVLTFLMPNFFGNPAHHSYFDFFTGQRELVTVNAYGEPIFKIDWGIKNYVEGGAYVGVLPLVLAALGVWGWLRQRKAAAVLAHPFVPFMALLSGLALAFVFGTPLYALIYYLPGLNQLHSPFRWVWPLSLAVAVLAGFGVVALRVVDRRLVRAVAGVLIAAGVGMWLAVAVGRAVYPQIAGMMDALVFDLALAANAFKDGRMLFSYLGQWVLLAGLMVVLSGVVLALTGWRRAEVVIVAVVAVDLIANGWGFMPAVRTDLLDDTPPVVAFLQQDDSPWRLTTYAPNGQKTLNANTPWLYGLEDVRGYESIILKQYADYMALIEPQNELQFNRIAPLTQASSLDSPLLDLLNVKYVVTEVAIDNPRYEMVYADAAVRVYENLGVMPRAYGLPFGCGMQADDFAAAVQQYDPRQHVILDGPDTAPGLGAADCQPIEARVTLHEFNTVTVDVDFTEPGYLVLNDTYFSGWLAFVRPFGTDEDQEQRLEVLRANGNFRAVYLPAGNHTVRFRYSPNSIRVGGLMTGLTGLTLVLLAGLWAWRLVYREDLAEGSTVRRIAKNSVAPMMLNLMNRAIDLLFAAFYLRVLGPGEAGNYATAIVIIGWFDIWTNFGLNTWLTREASRDRANAPKYLSNTTLFRIGLGAVTFPLFMGALWLFQWRTGDLGSDTLWAIGLLAVGMLPSSISTGLTALFYAYEKAEYPAAIASLTTVLKVSLGAGVLILGWGFVGLAGVSIVVNMVTMAVLGLLVWQMFFRPVLHVDTSLQRQMANESFPLMLNHLLATVFFKSDVPMIRAIRGDVAVGQYSTAYKFVDAYNIIPSFFTFALFPLMARQAQDDRPGLTLNYHFAIKLLVAVAIPVAVATTFLATPMVGLLGGAEFLPEGALALQLMVWSMPFGWINSVTNYLLISLNQQRMLTRAFVIGVTFNIVTNAIFIPIYGFPAAAVTTILSEIIEGAAFQVFVYRELSPVPWWRLFWRVVLAGVGMAGVTYLGARVHVLVGLVLGGVVYGGLAVGLGVFNAYERGLLLRILPGGLQARLGKLAYFRGG